MVVTVLLMEFTAGMGTTAVFVLAALVWLAYLIPVWSKQREVRAAELEATRLQHTLRALTETTELSEAVAFDVRARDIARQRKLLEREVRLREAQKHREAVAKAREIDAQIRRIEQEVKVVVQSSTTRQARLRRTKLACTITGLVALAAAVVGLAVPGLWALTLAAVLLLAVAVSGLVMVNRSAKQIALVSSAAREQTEAVLRESAVQQPVADDQAAHQLQQSSLPTEEHMRSRSWTPQDVPEQRTTAPSREEYQELMAERIREALRREGAAAKTSAASEESFAELVGFDAEGDQVDTAEQRRVNAEDAKVADGRTVAPSLSEAAAEGADTDAVFDVHAAFSRRVG